MECYDAGICQSSHKSDCGFWLHITKQETGLMVRFPCDISKEVFFTKQRAQKKSLLHF